MVLKSVDWLRRLLLITFSFGNIFSSLYSDSFKSCVVGVDSVSIGDDNENSKGIRGSNVATTNKSVDNVKLHEDGDDGNDSGNDFLSIPLIPYHVQKERVRQRRRAMRQLNDDNDEEDSSSTNDEEVRRAQGVGALYQGFGTHYVDIWCGTPPQRQTLIVDTGSSATAFPCNGCKDCGELEYHIDGLYQQDMSSTFTKLRCNDCKRGSCVRDGICKVDASYSEGSSWYAFEAKDRCYVGGPHGEALLSSEEKDGQITEVEDGLDPMSASSLSFDLVFGCQTRLTGLFKTQLADGIMGMENNRYSFWKQLLDSKKTNTGTFALCFGRSNTADRDGAEAGALTLGGYDTRLHKTPLVFTKNMYSSGGYYNVHIRKIYIREGVDEKGNNSEFDIQQVNIDESSLNRGKSIIDSGTTDTYLMSSIRHQFDQAWEKITGNTYNNYPIYLKSASELDQYPTIMLQLSGNEINKVRAGNDASTIKGLAGTLDPDHPYDVVLSIPPENYIEYDAGTNRYVPRIYLTEHGQNILGANVMMGHDVVFDIKNNSVGFAKSDCGYTKLISDNGIDVGPNTVKTGDYESPLSEMQNNEEFEDGG